MGPLGAVTSYEYEKARVHASSVSGVIDVVKSWDRRYQHVDPPGPSRTLRWADPALQEPA